MREVVVSAWAQTSPFGESEFQFRESMFAGKSGVRNIRGGAVDADFPIPYAASLLVDPLPKSLRSEESLSISRCGKASLRTAELLLEQIPANMTLDAILWASGEGAEFDLAQKSISEWPLQAHDLAQVHSEYSLNLVAALLRTEKNISTPARALISSNNGCVSGNIVLGQAMQRIRSGQWQSAIVGTANFRSTPCDLMSAHLLNALTTAQVPPEQASCPFSLRRAGYVKAEAACAFLLEERTQAERRGARILGSIVGFGHVTDAFRLTDGLENASSATQAMQRAVADAGLSPEDINYINAHGTSTVLNDFLETCAIKLAFGQRAHSIPVSSLKSQIGHSSISSGAIEAFASMIMLQEQRIAPTINYNEPDPKCDLDYVPNVARNAELNYVLSNSFGFGGQNACLVLKKI